MQAQSDVESPLNAPSAPKIYRSFVLMSLCFSLNHGTVVAALSLASAVLNDKQLAGYSSGVLYIFYTFSALLAAPGLVGRLGAKRSLDIGLSLYCFYVASFLVAIMIPAIKWPACMIGSSLGGLAAGWIWTAQGAYFARCASLVSRQTGQPPEAVNSQYAATFGALYVGLEVAMKGVGFFVLYFVEKKAAEVLLYIVWTGLAVAAAFATFSLVKTLPKDVDEKPMSAIERLKGAWFLLFNNKKIILLGLFNVAFGLVSALLNFYINGTPTKNALGTSNVAALSSLIAIVATATSFPFSWLAKRFSNLPLMVFGAACWVVVACIVAFQSEKSLQGMKWGLVVIYVLVGLGRGVFESTNKATFADFFPNDRVNAFAIIIVQSGGSAAAAFFIFPYLAPHTMAWISMVTSILAVVALFYAFGAHAAEEKEAMLKNPLNAAGTPSDQ